jgi:hypothetical protein
MTLSDANKVVRIMLSTNSPMFAWHLIYEFALKFPRYKELAMKAFENQYRRDFFDHERKIKI